MSEQHEKFLQRLAASSQAVLAVARNQHRKGRTVEIPPLHFAPTAAVHEKYSDGGDLYVVTRRRIEVKHLGVNFTGPFDWPFKEVLVSSAASVERAKGSVLYYVSVSNDLSCACIIPGDTSERWYKVEKLNSVTGNVEKFYACPIACAQFEEL